MADLSTEPFKLRVLYAVTAALKGITVANGYRHNLGDDTSPDAEHPERVFRGRAWFGDDDPIPMLSILEDINEAEEVADPPANTSTSEYDWELKIQGFVDDDPQHPTDPAYRLLADVRRCLAAERSRKMPNSSQPDPFGLGKGKNSISKIKYGAGVVRPADDVSSKAYFWLTLVLRIVDSSSEPYA